MSNGNSYTFTKMTSTERAHPTFGMLFDQTLNSGAGGFRPIATTDSPQISVSGLSLSGASISIDTSALQAQNSGLALINISGDAYLAAISGSNSGISTLIQAGNINLASAATNTSTTSTNTAATVLAISSGNSTLNTVTADLLAISGLLNYSNHRGSYSDFTTGFTVVSTSSLVVPANPNRNYLFIQNLTTGLIAFNFKNPASLLTGQYFLNQYDSYTKDIGGFISTDAVNIAVTYSGFVSIQQG